MTSLMEPGFESRWSEFQITYFICKGPLNAHAEKYNILFWVGEMEAALLSPIS